MGESRWAGFARAFDGGAFARSDRASAARNTSRGALARVLPPPPIPPQKARAVLSKERTSRGNDYYEPSGNALGVTACFRLGPPVAPPYNFDHGFLDREIGGQHFLDSSKRQPPTARDHELFGLWEAAALSALVLRRDLKDACLAYLHFLRGHGADYAFCYDRFLMEDGAGGRVLRSALEDTYVAAMAFGGELLAVDDSRWQLAFDLCSDAVIVGNTNNDRYPYPSTENWQKTIGGHTLWISASVEMRVDPVRSFAAFDVVATLHAADMYNFDPKKQDATTGIPDAANGRFEVTGLAHEFLQFGDAKRSARFEAPLAALGRRR